MNRESGSRVLGIRSGLMVLAAMAPIACALAAQTDREPLCNVTAVRHWAQADVTRVAVEVTGSFVFRTDRLHNPERVYFDILNAFPRIEGRHSYTENLTDRLLKRIRVAETAPAVTRIVLDVAAGVEIHTSQLFNPNRLIVDLKIGAPSATPTELTQGAPGPPMRQDPPPKVAPAPPIKVAPARTDVVERVTDAPAGTGSVPPPPPVLSAAAKAASEPLRPESVRKPAGISAPSPLPGAPKAARHMSSGDTSLVRALGLKIQRVVIDPGHGGHDQGTQGPHGLLEKDLVLDVGLRLGKLIEDRLAAEVIYTRSDDTFIPLEGRTALANERKADLFISIHANSSPVPRITGVETYYLSLPDSKEAKDVAARENDSSQMSVFELQNLIQKITTNDKVEESREFADRVQTSLFAFSARTFPSEKNRGVKKAPFVVLIGAHMPSILAEVGFVSNAREEALLKKGEYRQKLADALYRGLSRYAEGLSHFQVAQNGK